MIRRHIGLTDGLVEKLRDEGEVTVEIRFHDGHIEHITIERIDGDAPTANYGGRR